MRHPSESESRFLNANDVCILHVTLRDADGAMTADAWDDPAAGLIYDALHQVGVDTTTFGIFGLVRQTVDYDLAAPVLVEWLPRVSNPSLKDAVARSIAGQSGRHRLGGRALLYEFTDPTHSPTLRWSIGNALAVVAAPTDGAGVRDALTDRRWGVARQMLCDALLRTKDPAAFDVLVSLIDDDDVAGHAISALRRTPTGRAVLRSPAAIAKLHALRERATSTVYARRVAATTLRKVEALT